MPEVLIGPKGQGRSSQKASPTQAQPDPRKAQKSAIRSCVDRLVSSGGFKFRRSAFRGLEPKVTLLAPPAHGIVNEPIPIDFSVNTNTPLHNANLSDECASIDSRCKDLMLLVKRWAKDRGVCHAAKGHLSPYCWSLLTIYYLQVGMKDRRPVLPPLPNMEASVTGMARQISDERALDDGAPKLTVGELFKGFVLFYNRTFEWGEELVCVRSGQRARAGDEFPIHMIQHEDPAKQPLVGPSIEDPFEPAHNLGECATAISLARLREEMNRADEMCSKGVALGELLEPWVPPDRDTTEHAGKEDTDEGLKLPAQN
jgi:hypothetical protein